MTDLHRALVDIRSIRRQVAQSSEFHGYGPLTLSGTAVLAVVAGMVQLRCVPDPAAHPAGYAGLWLATGVIAAAAIVVQMLLRANRLHSGMADAMIRVAVLQFLPAAVAGVAVALLSLRLPAGVFFMLPGLWQILFSLGVFSCCRCLPRPMYLVGVWFLLTGLVAVGLGDARALRPEMMAFPYAVGMALAASIHYLSAKAGSDEDETACG